MSDEIEQLRRQISDIGIAKVAKASGVHHNTLQDFVDARTNQLKHANVSKVVAGIRKLRQSVRPDTQGPEDLPDTMRGHGGVDLVGDAYTMIPVYDLSASAGDGALVEDEPPIGYEAFRAGELRRITKADYENLSIIRVSGDSMSPFLNTGDRVLVDRGITRVRKDGIYIIEMDGELMIKRCSIEFDTGHINVRSDNPEWPSQKVTKPERVRVVGRACWMARSLS